MVFRFFSPILKSFFLVSAIGLMSPVYGQTPEFNSVVAAFDSQYFSSKDSTYNSYQQYLQNDNFVAWGFNSWTESLLDMYEATGNSKYLTECNRLFALVLQYRDDKKNRMDNVRGQIVPGWGESYYLAFRHATMVNSALVITPMMRFRNLAINNATFYSANKIAIDGLMPASLQTFYYFNQKDLNSTSTANGTKIKYFFMPTAFSSVDCQANGTISQKNLCELYKKNVTFPQPFNMTLLMGQYAAYIFAASPNASMANYLVGIANHFIVDSQLKANPNVAGAWTWKYWKDGWVRDGLINKSHIEDITHGAIDIQFANMYFANFAQIKSLADLYVPVASVNIDSAWMKGFGMAFSGAMVKEVAGSLYLSNYVDGQYSQFDRPDIVSNPYCLNWPQLSVWAPTVLTTCTKLNLSFSNGVASVVAANASNRNISALALAHSKP